ncbi:NUMOD4 domain-containing protein [Flavobacterium sp. SUN046]
MENSIEVWMPIKNYEGFYEISDLGNVKSLSRNVFRKRRM